MNEAVAEGDSKPPGRRAGQNRSSIRLFLAVALLVVAADQALKIASFRMVAGRPVKLDTEHPEAPDIPYHDPINLVPRILSLKLTTNTGAVFGIFKGGLWFFVVVSCVATAVIGRIFWTSPATAWPLHLVLAMVLAGALGNLIDRLLFSAVRDMLLLFPGVQLPFGWTWPNGETHIYPWIFNLADAALVVGVSGLLILSWSSERRQRKPQVDPD